MPKYTQIKHKGGVSINSTHAFRAINKTTQEIVRMRSPPARLWASIPLTKAAPSAKTAVVHTTVPSESPNPKVFFIRAVIELEPAQRSMRWCLRA